MTGIKKSFARMTGIKKSFAQDENYIINNYK
jgi:hypothetical protein